MTFHFDEEGTTSPRFPATMMCRLLEVSTSRYYVWRGHIDCPPSPFTPRGHRRGLTGRIQEIFDDHNGFAGVRTTHNQLTQEGIETTRYAVRTAMKEQGLVTKYRRRTKKTTPPDPAGVNRGDLVRRKFQPAMPTTYLCGDITYLRTRQGWMYLATVIDLSTTMVVGWQIADRMTSQLVLNALAMAHQGGYVAGNAVFHSDRGSQYTSKQFADQAARMDVRPSAGEAGVCWDNAVTESFFSTLKLHLRYDKTQFASKFNARYDVGHWIEVYYNRRHIHSTTGMIPAEAMRQFRQRLDRATIEIAA